MAGETPHFQLVWGQLLPGYVKRLLYAGSEGPGLREQLAGSGVSVDFTAPENISGNGALYDAVFLESMPDSAEAFVEQIGKLASVLTPEGRLIILLHAPAASNPVFPYQEFMPLLDGAGFMAYRWWPEEQAGDLESGCVLLAVRHGYNPLAHARKLAGAGQPAAAIDLIEKIDNGLFPDQRTLVLALAEKHACYLQWMQQQPPPRRPGADSVLFVRAQKDFYTIIHELPEHHPSWRVHGELWRAFGNEDMAARLLRSVLHVNDNPATRALLNELKPDMSLRAKAEAAPEWTGKKKPPRILVITHENSDYGMDSLYDGLCMVLGAENVVEFPWKGTLHGKNIEAAQNYPCVFDYPGEAQSAAALEGELKAGRFDVILFADVVQWAYREEVRRLLTAAPEVPLAVYDTWDSPQNNVPGILEYLGRDRVDVYFKREMLAWIDYGADACPLPFGYPDRLVPENVPEDRPEDYFWAGKWLFGLRSLYLPYLEKLLDRKLSGATYSQESYKEALLRSRAGFSFFGFGFDTVRYWELPAHGCLLLAERPPIRIPHDFVDGESALFFDDLPELEEKMAWISAHPEACAAIARAGREHFLRYHTGSARARQFLGRLEACPGW